MVQSSGGDCKPSCQVRLVGRVGNAREIMENLGHLTRLHDLRESWKRENVPE